MSTRQIRYGIPLSRPFGGRNVAQFERMLKDAIAMDRILESGFMETLTLLLGTNITGVGTHSLAQYANARVIDYTNSYPR